MDKLRQNICFYQSGQWVKAQGDCYHKVARKPDDISNKTDREWKHMVGVSNKMTNERKNKMGVPIKLPVKGCFQAFS